MFSRENGYRPGNRKFSSGVDFTFSFWVCSACTRKYPPPDTGEVPFLLPSTRPVRAFRAGAGQQIFREKWGPSTNILIRFLEPRCPNPDHQPNINAVVAFFPIRITMLQYSCTRVARKLRRLGFAKKIAARFARIFRFLMILLCGLMGVFFELPHELFKITAPAGKTCADFRHGLFLPAVFGIRR